MPCCGRRRRRPPRAAACRAPPGPFRFVACVELHEFVGARAEDERQLTELIEQVPLDSIYYHTHAFLLRHKFLAGIYPNDFATWVAVHLRDQVLGERLAMVDPAEFDDLDALRDELVSVIDDHLRRLQIVPRIVSAAEPFDFVRSRIVEIPTGHRGAHARASSARRCSRWTSAPSTSTSWRRARASGGTRTTSPPGSIAGSASPALAARVRAVNPYGGSLERTRARLLQLCDEALAEGTRP